MIKILKVLIIIEFNGWIFYETEDDFFINLKNFILNFKIEDVIQSIFIINSWLPNNIFVETLNYIDNIIKITSDYNEIKNLIPGYFEVPSSDYYLNKTRNFKYISSFISNNIFTLDQVQRIKKCKNIEEVISSFNNGTPLSLSLKYKDSIFPLFSRDAIARIIDSSF